MTGRVVAEGRIGLDAGRAAETMQQHLLSEPAAWLAEIVRAAVLSRATRVSVTFDADDLYVRFDGDLWPEKPLESAALSVGSTGAAADRRGYLLAVAVYTAAGDGARVEVFSRSPRGQVDSVRIERGRAPGADRARRAPKDGEPLDSLCVHVEHPLSKVSVGRLAGLRTPPEVAFLAARLDRPALEVNVGGSALSRHRPPVLCEVPIEEEDGLVIEVLGAHDQAPRTSFVELGVEIVSVPWEGALGALHGGVGLPVRAVVRRDRIATNVSRSRVSEEIERRVGAAVAAALPCVVGAARERISRATTAEGRAAFERALSAMAVVCAALCDLGGADELSPDLRALLELPLLTDATGRPRSLSGARRLVAENHPIHLYEGERALTADHLPFVHDVYWVRGHVAEAYLRKAGALSYRTIAREVATGLARRAEALGGSEGRVEVRACPEHLIVHRTETGTLRAEVAVRAPARLGKECVIRLFADRRLIETVTLESSSVPFDAAIEWPEVLVPNRRYDGVRRGSGLDRAVSRLERLALQAIEAHGAGVPQHRHAELRELVGIGVGAPGGVKLAGLRVWPTLAGGLLTTEEVRARHEADGAVRVVGAKAAADPRARGSACGLCLVLEDSDRRALRCALGPKAVLFDYDELLGRGSSTPAELAAALPPGIEDKSPVVSIDLGGMPAVAAVAEEGSIAWVHRGVVLGSTRRPVFGGLALALDVEVVAFRSDGATAGHSEAEVWARVIGALAALPEIGVWLDRSARLKALLVEKARRVAIEDPSWDALRELPLFSSIEDGVTVGRRSAGHLAAWRGTTLACVGAPPSPEVKGLYAVIADLEEATLLTRLTGKPSSGAAETIERLRRRARSQAETERLLAAPPRDPEMPPPGARAGAPLVVLPGRPTVRRAVVALLTEEALSERPVVTVLFRGRQVFTTDVKDLELPISLLIDLETRLVGSSPSERVLAALRKAAACAATSLALAVLRDPGPTRLDDPGLLRVLAFVSRGPERLALGEALTRSDLAAPTIQGGHAPLSLLLQDTTVLYGRERHTSWAPAPAPGPLDSPILHIPQTHRGSLIKTVLSATGRSLSDVTEATARRAQGLDVPPVVARPPPVSPLLRVTLERLRVADASGEIDIVDERTRLDVADASGRSVVVAAESLAALPCGVIGSIEMARRASGAPAVVQALALSLERYLRDLAPHLDDLPPFVRGCVRRHVVAQVAKKQRVSKALRQTSLFPLRGGGLVSLDQVEADRPALDVPLGEAVALLRAFGATAVETPTMTEADRARCLVTANVRRIGEGEVGIGGVSLDGAVLTHLGLPIGRVPKLLSFSATGALEVPTLTREEIQQGALDPIRLVAIVAAAEREVLTTLDKSSAPSERVLARRFVDGVWEGVRLSGWLWIPDSREPQALVVTPGEEGRPTIGSRVLPPPVTGKLFTASPLRDPAVARACDVLARAIFRDLTSELPAGAREQAERYLALLEPSPHDDSWLTDVRGQIHRGEAVPIAAGSDEIRVDSGRVVLGALQPLARALARWAPSRVEPWSPPPLMIHEVPRPGPRRRGKLAPKKDAMADPVELADSLERAGSDEAALLAQSADQIVDPDGAPEPRLLDSLLALFGIHATWDAPHDHPIVRRLERVLLRLPLPMGVGLSFARGGRPVRFEGNRVVLDPQHPVILALIQRDDVVSLASAIVVEANRSSEQVTHAELCRALSDLILET